MTWQPIDTAPKDGTDVLLWRPGFGALDGWIVIGSYREDENLSEWGKLWLENDYNEFSTGYASTPIKATHWQPLPEPPEAA